MYYEDEYYGHSYSDKKKSLMHYGVGHKDGGNSGRYPWGSGDVPYQHDTFLAEIKRMTKEGKSEVEQADFFGISTTEFRKQKAAAKHIDYVKKAAIARKLRDEGKSFREIAKEIGFTSESSVRNLLDEERESRKMGAANTAAFLKQQLEAKGALEVGKGVERELGISESRLKEALYLLEIEGYPTYSGRVPQPTNPDKQTTVTALCPKGTPPSGFYELRDSGEIHSVVDYVSNNDGESFVPRFQYPKSMDSSRLEIRYADDGGKAKDGVIELRRGVADLDLGGKHYAQVRILVDGNRYLKGMAVYGDDSEFPDGVDVIFNTNKTKDVPKMEVLKKTEKNLEKDPSNPFGARIERQSYYFDEDGKETLGLLNIRSEQGNWQKWDDKLPSQFLSKQPMKLIQQQLKVSADSKILEYKEIQDIDNPMVKQKLLMSFADDCEAAAVHLKAASLPRQKYQVILPLDIPDDQVYAPQFKDGETLALVRFPHGGTFEIPKVTVNNKNAEGRRVIGTSGVDAIGISSAVAERLSGADFDGDTVMCVPITKNVNIKNRPPLKDLVGFDPKEKYAVVGQTLENSKFLAKVRDLKKKKHKDGSRYSTEDVADALDISVDELKKKIKEAKKDSVQLMRDTQHQMGVISNLITDMTLFGADDDQLARAVKHSMVVIDAEKHNLNYKQSEIDNDIPALVKEWQVKEKDGVVKYGGASSLISRAKSEVSVPKTQGEPHINIEGTYYYDPSKPEGSLVYKKADNLTYTRADGKLVTKTKKSTAMMETTDAYELVNKKYNTPQERAYAEYANTLKSLALQARKEAYYLPPIKKNKEAALEYAKEVEELMAGIRDAELNKPRERIAQLMAYAAVEKAKDDSEDPMPKAEIKKTATTELAKAREKVGARGVKLNITDNQWKAIQAGAISANVMSKLMSYADEDRLKELATPRAKTQLSPAKQARLKDLAAMGYTQSQIAAALKISATTVNRYLEGAA